MTKLLRALAWNHEEMTWAQRLRYRKDAGYNWQSDIIHIWEKWLVWRILRIMPRAIKYWTVVEVATKNEKGNPGEVTAITMLKRYEEKQV